MENRIKKSVNEPETNNINSPKKKLSIVKILAIVIVVIIVGFTALLILLNYELQWPLGETRKTENILMEDLTAPADTVSNVPKETIEDMTAPPNSEQDVSKGIIDSLSAPNNN